MKHLFKSKSLTLFAIAAFLVSGFFVFTGSASAANLNVGPDEDYTTIQAAVTAASPDDIINVAAGTYNLDSQIRIEKAITIVGAGTSTVITKDSTWTNTTGEKGHASLITIIGVSDPVVLQNFKVTGAATIGD